MAATRGGARVTRRGAEVGGGAVENTLPGVRGLRYRSGRDFLCCVDEALVAPLTAATGIPTFF
ncbi:hypothetical protein [Nocardia carnea]|uniref:hypothetical protein n=1 Tax=Nocardia carnea TaxID=37328 RepID=UPI002457FCEE|nr:hypothetical protein [Nocardia carnea]